MVAEHGWSLDVISGSSTCLDELVRSCLVFPKGKMLLLAEGYVDTSELETWRVRPTSATWLPCALPPPYHRCHTIAATYRSSPPDDA